MTALLGMLAMAGYQNRDKLAEMLNKAAGSVSKPESGGQPRAQGDLLGGLSSMLGGAGVGGLLGGGLSELLEQFTKNGQGETAESWVGTGPNKEVSPPQLKQAIGQDVLAALGSRQGFPRKSFSHDWRENCQQPSTNTHRTVIYPRATLKFLEHTEIAR
jgi:uncharacterized protein YidB (DUF937 family)